MNPQKFLRNLRSHPPRIPAVQTENEHQLRDRICQRACAELTPSRTREGGSLSCARSSSWSGGGRQMRELLGNRGVDEQGQEVARTSKTIVLCTARESTGAKMPSQPRRRRAPRWPRAPRTGPGRGSMCVRVRVCVFPGSGGKRQRHFGPTGLG